MNTEKIAMALYRPNPGKEETLKDIVKIHLPTLANEGLITERTPIHLEATDGTIIEIFGWKSEEAKDKAHQSSRVLQVWEQMMEVAEMTNLSSLSEANQPFPNFKPLSL